MAYKIGRLTGITHIKAPKLPKVSKPKIQRITSQKTGKAKITQPKSN